jgi:hypothetical protein
MTDEPTVYRLTGWLRLVPGDCVGIAIFTDGSNMQFLPETDDRLRISEFHAFFNEEGYTIERRLPPGADAAAYSVGSGVPIPFAKGGVTIIADSEGGSGAFLKGQDRGDPTVKSVAEIIEKAETGAFEREGLVRKELEFESRHSAVFLEGPVHSRYWIEHLKRAALEAVTLPEPPHQVIRARLQLIIEEWIKRFQTSGDPALLGMFLQEVESLRLVQPAYVKRIYFYMATRLLASRNYKDLLAPALAKQIQKAIPEGLYYHYHKVNARSSKRTRRTDRVTEDVDLLSHMRELIYDGDRSLDFRVALEVANLMFGREALHPDIHAQAKTIASHLVELIERGIKSYTGRPPDHLVDQLVAIHRALVTLRQMMDWKDRSDSTVVALGLSKTATFLMEQWLEDRA